MAILERQVRKTQRAVAAHESLVFAAQSLDVLQNHQLDSFGLTLSQYRVLEALLQAGPMNQAKLSARFFWVQSNTHFVVRGLEARGLVVRRARERDKRTTTIHLTPEGEALIAEAFPLHAMLVRAQMSVLDAREQETLCRLCVKLSQGDPAGFIMEIARSAREEIEEAEEAVES
jgi:MarR family transcriptional regulator, 2-MHQ and catechol-resistance regulon repressor